MRRDVEELDVDPTASFNPTMIESCKARVAEIEKQVRVVADGMDIVPEAGDFDALRHAMACIYDVKTKSNAIEFELDTLHEITGYLLAAGEKSVGAAEKKVRVLPRLMLRPH